MWGNFRLGLLLAQGGELDRALPRFRRTVELKPEWADARFKLAMVLLHLKELEAAQSQLEETIRLEPVDQSTRMQLAWILASHPDPRFRNGEEAMRWAQAVCGDRQTFQSPDALDVLGAACAEAGRFPQAIERAEKARSLANAANNQQLAAAIESRLQLYRNNRAFHGR